MPLRDKPKSGNSVASYSRASPRDAMPLTLRLPRPRCGLAMTQIWSVFIWKTDVLHFCGYFLRGVAPHRFSNVLFRKSFRFPAKPFGATGTAGGFLATRKSFGDCFLQFLLLQHQGFFFFRGCILLQLHFVCVQTFISTTSASARILERQHNAGHNPGPGRAWKIPGGKSRKLQR